VRDLPGPRRLPLLGNILQLDLPRIHQVLERWAREFGPVYRFYMGPRPVLVVAGPDLVAEVLRRRPETYRKIENLEPIFRELGAAGVFSAEGREWRPQRKLAMEALALKHLRAFFPKLREVAARLRRRWQNAAASGATVDLKADLMRFTVDVTTSLVFGTDTNTLERDDDIIQHHLSQIFPAFHRRLFGALPVWRWVRLPADRRVDRAVAEVRRWIAGRIAEARARVAGDAAPRNFIEAMVLARDDDGRPFTDELISANALTMLLGGEDTTALTVAWAAHHLCERPDAVRALQAELDGAVDGDGVPADLDTANRLAYAGAVASETMRLRPVAPMFFNASVQDTQLGDVAVPAGTAVMTLLRFASLDDANFPAAAEFRPERWLPGAPEQRAAASVPFGSGPRICPGRSLALLELKVLLAALYRGFDVERVGDAAAVRERYAFTMMPEGLAVRLRARA
jgi:cytochrome P450